MAYSDRSYARPYIAVPGLPPAIKWLIIINVAIFIGEWFSRSLAQFLIEYFALTPVLVVHGYIWQLGTYLFLHSPSSIWHILFNMLTLWMFGADIEQTWGTRRFLQFYFFCGIGAGVCVVALNYIFSQQTVTTLGASGAIYGILLACAILWPDRLILMAFLFPIKMKYFVIIFGALAFLNSFNINSGVSEFAHLGGMAFAFLFLKAPRLRSGSRGPARSSDPFTSMGNAYRAWKLARAKRKFQVYLKKQGKGPWVN
jgi:membrane associated rhomboid family serine protease